MERKKKMNIILWILQGFLAVLFLVFGYMRVIKSKDELKEMGGRYFRQQS